MTWLPWARAGNCLDRGRRPGRSVFHRDGTTPAGVSGAVLPPFQASVLDTHIMAIAPTNLVYNIIASPGALYRYWRQGQTGGPLTRLLIAGTLPGVIAGCVIRAEFLPA